MASDESGAGGGTTTEGSGYLTRLAVHDATRAVAEQVGVAVRAAAEDLTTVLLVEDRDLLTRDATWGWVVPELDRQTTALHRARTAVEHATTGLGTGPAVDIAEDKAKEDEKEDAGKKPAPVSPLKVVSDQLSSAADVLALVGGEHTVASAEVSVTTGPLTAAVAADLLATSKVVVVDTFRLLTGEDPVSAAVGPAAQEATDLAAALRRLEEALEGTDDDDTPHSPVALAKGVRAAGTVALERWQTTLTALTAAPEKGLPPLVAAAVQAAVHGEDPAVGHVLALSLDAAGADVVTRRGLLVPAGRLWVIGGVTTSWLLLDTKNAALVGAGTLTADRRLAVDLTTGQHVSSTLPAAVATLPTRASHIWQRVVVLGLAAAGAAWLVIDSIAKLSPSR